jgi:hypothetical protein
MTQNISQLLEIFRTAISGDEKFKEDVSKILLAEVNVIIENKNILFKNGNIQIKCDHYTKTEINLYKEKILFRIKEKYPNKKNININ